MARVKSFTDAQLKEEFKKIQKAISNTQIQAFSQTLKRTGPVRKSLARKHLTKPKSTLQELDLATDAQTFIKVVSSEDSDDEAHPVWSAFILHMVDRQDLVKLYGLVVQYYETHHVAGAGLILWGDLQVLFDSHDRCKGSYVWQHQHLWEIRSWRLYTLSNVHILETVSGEVLSMFADVSYPLSVKLIKKMLRRKLEIDNDVVGNDMTTAEQLIQFIKNQLADAQVSSV
nr:aminoacyl-tRNA synthetase, class 1a, anticodon-binding [Tanacetum cinerariifolium]